MTASVPTLGQAKTPFCEQLPEGLVAHHEMGDRFARRLSLSVCGGEADDMYDAVVDHNFYVSKKQCWLHGCLPAMRLPQKGQHHHREGRSEIRDFVNFSVFVQDGFRAVSHYNPDVSRAPRTTPRECRWPKAGMVALSVPSDMGHRSSSSVWALLRSPFISVAGNGDSNVQVQSRGIMLQGCGARVHEPARAAHA